MTVRPGSERGARVTATRYRLSSPGFQVPEVPLTHLTEPGQLAAISKIDNVALVLVPEALAAAYVAIPLEHVAQTVYIPGGGNARVHTGTLEVGVRRAGEAHVSGARERQRQPR